MNCQDSEAWLQDWLDGSNVGRPAGWFDHLAECQACRQNHAAAQRLLEGMTQLARPIPPADLGRRLLASVIEDRLYRKTQMRWRLGFTAALAAAILLMIVGGYLWLPTPGARRAEAVATRSGLSREIVAPAKAASAAALAQTIEKAKNHVASLGGQTFHQAQQLLAAAPSLDWPNMGTGVFAVESVDPTGPLRQTSRELSEGLEPVTSSARRAMDLFLRELSTFEVKNPEG